MKRAIIALFLLFLVSGCGSSNVQVKADEGSDAIKNSELAYVLVSYKGQAYCTWTHTNHNYGEASKPLEVLYLSGKVLGDEQHFFVQLVPGTYTLSNFHQQDLKTSYNMTTAAMRQNESMKHSGGLIGSFTAEKGKITYIGRLGADVDRFTTNFSFYVRDYQKDDLEFLKQNYPNIDTTNLLVIKLARSNSR